MGQRLLTLSDEAVGKICRIPCAVEHPQAPGPWLPLASIGRNVIWTAVWAPRGDVWPVGTLWAVPMVFTDRGEVSDSARGPSHNL